MKNIRAVMALSGDIWVLNKLAQLAQRCGVSPTVANFSLKEHWDEDGGDHHYALSYIDGNARTDSEREGIAKVVKLLGFGDDLALRFPDLIAVDEAVDRALTLAPRARTR